MTLAPFEDVRPLLRAPGGGQVSPETLADVSARKRDGDGAAPPPVLVDFQRSVIEPGRADGAGRAPQIDRPNRSGVAAWVKRLLSPEKAETRRNLDRFLVALRARSARPRVLVVGGGTVGQGMGALYEAEDVRLVAFDIYPTPLVQFVADAHAIPLADGAMDGVVVQAVLEHVLDPSAVVEEIARVLGPGGLVYAETPFMQQVHEGAYDFTRFTESGHRNLFRRFERIDSGSCGGPGLAFMWSVDHLARGLLRSRSAGKLAKLMVFWVQYLDRLIPEAYAIDGASGVFFLGAKSERAIGPKEAVAHYQGAQ